MENEDKLLDYLKQVTAKLRRTRQSLREAKERNREPIAIVGMGCRYPGGVRDPEALWSLLAAGADAISGFPQDRGWDFEALLGSEADQGSYVSEGGFLHGVADFDPGFFGISPREAMAMDPQQRLLLEIAWEALERAGIDPETLRGTLTGVFAGSAPSGYIGQTANVQGAEAHLITGNVLSVISGRISYTLGLEGPAVTVDTACSSSLVALHLACQALRAGECTLALAGGVTVIAEPSEFVGFSKQGALAADGRCKAFSAEADGMGMAEGAGMLLLERLSDARRNGHPVLAVVAGGAINQDGASNGLTAPNGPSQQRVIRAALASAKLATSDVDAVEAHGTGTSLGDPIEAQAIIATYGQDRPADRPLWLGSVKSNIGHSQQASGVVGVIKMVLALRHELLPKTLYAENPSPHVDWDAGDVRLLSEPVPWPAGGEKPRRAGVSSFGLSGTNAHIIIEEAPGEQPAAENIDEGDEGDGATTEAVVVEAEPPVLAGSGIVPWVVSGRGNDGLTAQAGRLREFAVANPDLVPVDVAWSLATSRSTFEHRAVVTGTDREELAAGLAAVATAQPGAGVVTGAIPDGGIGRVVFVFPGQGSQWIGMGRELAKTSPVFAARLAECALALKPYVDWNLDDVLAGADGAPPLETADVVQPALWAVMVSLAAVWQAAGVRPDAVVGHSQGEIAAACVAGILLLEDAARVVALRSKSLRALAGKGGMLSIAEPADTVRERLAPWGDRLSVAAVNGPAATVVSGAPDALRELKEVCEGEDVRARMIPVDYASHSAQVDELHDEIVSVLDGIMPNTARIPMISSMSGEWLAGPEVDANYWYDSLREPVEFDRAIRALAADGHQVFVEVSPHPVLANAITDSVEQAARDAENTGADIAAPVVTGTLRRDDGGAQRLLTSLSTVHVCGIGVDWKAVIGEGTRIDLPTYAFQHQRYWPQATAPHSSTVAGEQAGSVAEAEFWAAVESGNLRALANTLSVDDESLGEVLPALATWRRRERDDTAVADWRYRVTWAPVTDPAPVVLSGTWIVVAAPGDGKLTPGCVRALTDRGAKVVTLETTETDRTALAALLREVAAPEPHGIAGVLSLAALDETPVAEFPIVPTGLAVTLGLVQALGDAEITAPLWVVTQGAVATGHAERLTHLTQAEVWGLGQVAGLEDPDHWGGLIDLPPSWDERAAARLSAVLAGCGEDQVALRTGGMLARRLVRAPLSATRKKWTPRGTVLVTGGTGSIGGYFGKWLAGRGAQRLVLTSRSGPAAAGVAGLVADLAGAGTAVDVIACDTARRTEVAGLLDRIETTGPPLSSVAHAAGVARAAMVHDATLEELSDVAAAKVGGAIWLDELTAGLDLDAFVLFSSGAAAWGSGLLGGYAAANAYLDALADDRRARGLAATSVAWGLWGGGGMGAGDAGDHLRRYGLRVMDPDKAIQALAQALDGRDGLLAVADIDWEQFAPAFTLRRPSPLIETVPEAKRALAGTDDGPAAGGAQTDLEQRLAGLSRAEQERMLTDLVRAEAAVVLGYSSVEDVEAQRAFKELGFDSVTAVELRNRLNTTTGLQLPSTLIFDYPSSAALADYLRDELLGVRSGPRSAAPVVTVSGDDPIAIIGMACRYPGGIASPEHLWDVLSSGTDATSDFPQDRGWDTEGMYTRHGGFVQDAAEFDPGFFGISPREALAMDPQQRLLLEVSWEALERAGIDPTTLRGSQTGVFAGGWLQVYGTVLAKSSMAGYTPASDGGSVISGRVSYTLGLEGPALTIDTACSASLVALHLAANALRNGECSLALAGGVTVMPTPGAFGFGAALALAENGRCKPFSADADGMGMGEGAAMLAVERLSDARRNGHQVLAIVRGSAVNQDGASNGLTAPNGPSQERVIRTALASAGLTTNDVDAIEAHGTGTVLGDPIEAGALIRTYGQGRDGRPLWLGSIKSNLGHTQAAAGVAGIMKMILGMRHEVLPRTLHAEEPSPHIDWAAGDVRLAQQPVPWPAGSERPRRAGISGFGISGTNAHVIIEEPPAEDDIETAAEVPAPTTTPVLAQDDAYAWLVSGRTMEGLAAQAGRLREFALAHPDRDPADVAWSLVTTRSTFAYRGVVTGADREELAARLAAVATAQPTNGAVTGTLPVGGIGRIVFVFPGQGSQWVGMGREMLTISPVFADRFAECEQALAPYVDWSLGEVLLGAEGAPGLDAAVVLQPVLWAVMVSLAAVWEAVGVHPDAVVGHSQGEIAAATVAGILSLEDAARVVALRSQALSNLDAEGGMISAVLPVDQVREIMEPWADRLSIAAVNGPNATVVSGEPEALTEFEKALRKNKVLRWRIPETDFVAHSPLVEPLESVLAESLAAIRPAPGRARFYSTVHRRVMEGAELDAAYWYANVRQTVNFADTVLALVADGHRTFVEASAHPVLTTAITEIIEADKDLPEPVVTGTLRREDGGASRLLFSFGDAHVHGVPVDWTAVFGGGQRIDLPTYAFQHERYWPKASGVVASGAADLGQAAVGHPMLGAAVELAGGAGLLCTGRLSLRTHTWLADHSVQGTVILPGSAFAELAFTAADRAGCGGITDLTLESPLILPAEGSVQVQVTVAAPDASGHRTVEIYSRTGDAASDAPWTRHASGILAPAAAPVDPSDTAEFTAWPPAAAEPVEIDGFYQTAADGGYGIGPTFHGLRAVWRRGDDVFAEVSLPDEVADDAAVFGLHPALLDAAQQAGIFATGSWEPGEARLSFGWNGMTLHAMGARTMRVRLRADADGNLSLLAADPTGAPVVAIDSLIMRTVEADQLDVSASRLRDSLFGVDWTRIPGAGAAAGRWAVLGDPSGIAAGLARTGIDVRTHLDLAALAEAVASGEQAPDTVLFHTPATDPDDPAGSAVTVTGAVLELVQDWLNQDRLGGARLVIITRGAMATVPGEPVTDLAGATVWGLIRSAQTENPDRLVLLDLPEGDIPFGVVAAAIGSGESELAVRGGSVHVRRLARPDTGLAVPRDGQPWRLAGGEAGLALVPNPEATGPLDTDQVRIAVRAAALATGEVTAGRIAGVVVEIGSDVRGLLPGDRVLATAPDTVGPVAIADADAVTPIPAGQSFAVAAADGAPMRAWDVRRAADAFGALRAGGAVVLTIPADPAAPRTAGTVLITGGTGTLGAVFARHLADTGRAKNVVLTSRTGPAAGGVAGTAAQLAAHGVGVQVVSCDVTDRDAVAGLLAAAEKTAPLTGVIHAAGVLDDGVISSLTPERVERVIRPKADAAWHLHQLTQDRDLEMFVLFSSAAVTLGAPGQGNYAAANGFLDGIAAHRTALGLPAVSLTWGLWADASAMTGHLSEAEKTKFARTGIGSLSTQDGLALLDAALDRDESLLVPVPLNIPTLRMIARAGGRLPACLRALAPAPRVVKEVDAEFAGPALQEKLAKASEAEQHRLLVELVRGQTAGVLGHDSAEAIEIDSTFLEQGLDSLTAVEFRNRLNTLTGLRMTGAVAFDHPTPALLADHLRAQLAEAGLLSGGAAKKEDTGGYDERRYVASGAAAPTTGTADSLSSLYLRALRDGRAIRIMELIKNLAAFRPSFRSADELANVPRMVPISRGPNVPGLICLPSFAGSNDAQEFARFAGGFRGDREVSVLPNPGFVAGEPLAATVEALIDVHARNIRNSVHGAPFVLAGYSSGGLVAHMLAATLANDGLAPAAVVLLDSFTPEIEGVPDEILAALPGAVMANNEQQGNVGGDDWLTAMAHYYSFDWRGLARIDIPTLLVRADTPVGEVPENSEFNKSSWKFSSKVTFRDVPGDHFSIMGDKADTTARAVNDWLAELQGGLR